MNRKDTIIIATLLNVAILSILFITAVNYSDDSEGEMVELSHTIAEGKKIPEQPAIVAVEKALEPSSTEKFDLLFNDLDEGLENSDPDEEWSLFGDHSYEPLAPPEISQTNSNVVEIAVKKGDTLERIARANGTTIASLKELNGLKSDRLRIGQLLQVEVGSVKPVAQTKAVEKPKSSVQAEAVYYTLKSGDSPWKVAKECHVNMDELLRLNHLDEEKARNLKVGDKLRVK